MEPPRRFAPPLLTQEGSSALLKVIRISPEPNPQQHQDSLPQPHFTPRENDATEDKENRAVKQVFQQSFR